MVKKKNLDVVALFLVIIGGLNLGLMGLLGTNYIWKFLGEDGLFTKIIYILIGLSALYSFKFFARLKTVENKKAKI